MNTVFYIGPAQVAAGATLRVLGDDLGADKYGHVAEEVDAARLRELAAQNLLALFYTFNLYESEDRPTVLLGLKESGAITGCHVYHSLARGGEGDVELFFSDRDDLSRPAFGVRLSDILLVQVFERPVPDYVRRRLEAGDFLRHPATGEAVFPVSHRTFYGYAAGRVEMPEPFTVVQAGRVVPGLRAAQVC